MDQLKRILQIILYSHAHIGGQAVMEGVMMRSKHYWAIAVRQPDGNISVFSEKLNTLSIRYPILQSFFLRGTLGLVETMVLGFKALAYSANQSTDDDIELTGKDMAISFVIAMFVAIGLFLVTPYFLVRSLNALDGSNFLFTMVEGIIKIGMFVGYIFAISRLNDVRRLFQYHGAEHKTINSLEENDELTIESCQKYSTVHVRCGTTFILIVMVLSIMVFTLLPVDSVVQRVGMKLMLLPIVAGVAYELIRLAGRSKESIFTKILVAPGLLLQKLTTKEPTDDMVEVALVALNATLEGEMALTNANVLPDSTQPAQDQTSAQNA